jgi:GntR family L-lactate dehydrogenase operon transcriptional regulator
MRVSDQVVQSYRRLIEQRNLKQGDRLPAERQLATSLGISRPSLREAIQQLISLGILSSRVAMALIFNNYLKHGRSS